MTENYKEWFILPCWLWQRHLWHARGGAVWNTAERRRATGL